MIRSLTRLSMRNLIAPLAGAALASLLATTGFAMPISAAIQAPAGVTQVEGGCGPGYWRGPWGGCRNMPYSGPLPGGYYQEAPLPTAACPPGYWRGPWGHCRNTPYHGQLPDGSYQP